MPFSSCRVGGCSRDCSWEAHTAQLATHHQVLPEPWLKAKDWDVSTRGEKSSGLQEKGEIVTSISKLKWGREKRCQWRSSG